jgi:hypothetical protein
MIRNVILIQLDHVCVYMIAVVQLFASTPMFIVVPKLCLSIL